MSFLPGMSAAVTTATTPERRGRARDIDRQNAGVRVGAEHQRGFERAGHGRHIVEIERRAGDMADGAVVADRGVHAAADAREGRRHSASNRMGAVGLPVSS